MAPAQVPDARAAENRGRLWLVLGFVLCPCHLPLTMAVLGTFVGGGVLGAAVRDAWMLGTAMAVLYGLTVWRGFVHLRRAKAALGPGESLTCSPAGECTVVPAEAPA